MLRYVLYAAAALTVIFFALTRTEVGREGLRTELERQFGRSFHGQLEIGELKGNLLNRLSARDVEIRDSAGRSLLSVDSVVIHPSWWDMFDRTVSTGEITLIRPEIHLVREADGSWNVNTLIKRRAGDARVAPWSFHATRVNVQDGRVVTTNLGLKPPPVEDSLIFDYTEAEMNDILGRLIVDWEPEMRLIDVLELRGRVPELEMDVHELRGQFILEDQRLALNEVHLQAGASEIHLTGSVSSLDDLRKSPATASVELDLSESVLHGEELHRILPFLPLRDVVTAEAHVQGPISGLVVEELSARRGGSRISLEATLLGLPDSLDFEMSAADASVSWKDLEAVWPENNLPAFDQLGSVQLSGYAAGILHFAGEGTPVRLDGSANLDVESEAGRLRTTSRLELGGNRPVHVVGSVEAVALDLGLLARRAEWTSSLTGRLTLDAEGPTIREVHGDGVLALTRSALAGRYVDSLRLELSGSTSQFAGDFFASQRSGFVRAGLAANLSSAAASYRLSGMSRDFDLGPLIRNDSLSSGLNTRFTVAASGSSWNALEGEASVEFDSSIVRYGDQERAVPPHSSHLAVRQMESGSPQILLDGDIAELEVTGDVAFGPFDALTAHWTRALRDAVAREQSKYYRPAEENALVDEDPVAPFVLRESAAASLERAGLSDQKVRARLKILRSDILSSLLPMLPVLRTNAQATAEMNLSEDEMSVEVSVAADSMHVGDFRSYGIDARLAASAPSDEGLAELFSADLAVTASSIAAGDQSFIVPSVTSTYRDRGFEIEAEAEAPGAADALQLSARMDLLDDRNRLTIRRLQLAVRDQSWTTPGEHAVDFYKDAVVFRGVRLERATAAATETEHLLVAGTLSASPEDTLVVGAENILLESITGLIAVDRPLGGTVNGRIALTGLKRQPELTGDVTVAELTYENRFLGELTVSSRYIPGSPDVALSARLLPAVTPDSSYIIEESELTVDGTFRLPGLGSTAERQDPGAIDLDVQVARADAFFLEYIFRGLVSDVHGWLAGQGHIGGSFDRPVFDARLDLNEGDVYVPEFRLNYAASGPVSVDGEGIHLNGISVTDPSGGEASISGAVLFNDYRYFSFDLAGTLDELRIMNVGQSRDLPFYGRIWASGNMTLTGPLSSATLQSNDARTTRESDLYIPISESGSTSDAGFIVFADSTGRLPDISRLTRRRSLLAERPAGERPFLDGLEIDLNISAPNGSTVHLVIDPLVGDVINAVGSGRIQLVREEGEFTTFGTFNVSSGDYLFTAGEVFFRRFLIDSGSITWDGDPLNAVLDISASYRTRASTDGLPLENEASYLIPLIIRLNVAGRVISPSVDLALAVDRDDRSLIGGYEGLEAILNQPELAAQYATSVLLTNSFLLTASAQTPIADSRNQLAFNSLSQLVASQLNRYLNYALPNVDLNFGVQGESTEDLDVTYGVALRLLDERLIIRGQGIYQNELEDRVRRSQQGMLDEFVVELRLNSRVSVEVFYRREGDILSAESLNTSTTGAGLSYQTEFSTWRRLIERLFGKPDDPKESDEETESDDDVVADTGE